jgi:two-component system, cell cycle sensor histidine kinase and response regulator CckA
MNPHGTSLPALLRFSRTLHGATSLEELLDRVREFLLETTRYRWAYVHLHHPDGKTFEIAGWVLPNAQKLRASHVHIDVSRDRLLQRVIQSVEPFVVNDLRTDPDADQRQVEATGICTSIVVPMFDHDARIGPLVVATFTDQGPLPPLPEELELILPMAALVGSVIGRLRAHEARVDAEARLAQADKLEALGRMAGEVAHDFNNVLFAVLANIELAIAEVKPHAAVTLLEDARQAAERAARLSKQLLASSRGQVLARDPVNLGTVLQAAQKLVEPTLPANVKLEISETEADIRVLGDGDELTRVLTNLLVNARDAVAHGGNVTVELRSIHVNGEYIAARDELRAGDYALLSVADDGIGMTLETQARVFEPFFSTKGPERGTGLGLSVVLGVTKQHGGYVHVYSELGLGTTFKVYLPLANPSSKPTPNPTAVGDSLDGSETILVVDDDEHVRRTLYRVLTRRGYQVHTEATARGALERLAMQPFSLLVSDIVLGSEDGSAFVAEARRRFPDLRAVFITGYTRSSRAALGAPHLVKPFASEELLRLVRATLTSK